MRLLEVCLRHAQAFGRERGLVDPGRIVEYDRKPALANVATNPLDDLRGGERLAEDLDRAPPPLFAHHVPARAEPFAQRFQRRLHVIAASVDAGDVEVAGHSRCPCQSTYRNSLLLKSTRHSSAGPCSMVNGTR